MQAQPVDGPATLINSIAKEYGSKKYDPDWRKKLVTPNRNWVETSKIFYSDSKDSGHSIIRKVVKTNYYAPDSNLTEKRLTGKVFYGFNKKGDLESKVVTDTLGEVVKRISLKYDNKYNVLEYTDSTREGGRIRIKEAEIFKRDSAGRLTEFDKVGWSIRDSAGYEKLDTVPINIYKYDKNGSVVEEHQNQNGYKFIYRYTLDEKERLCCTYSYQNGSWVTIHSEKYDARGNCVEVFDRDFWFLGDSAYAKLSYDGQGRVMEGEQFSQYKLTGRVRETPNKDGGWVETQEYFPLQKGNYLRCDSKEIATYNGDSLLVSDYVYHYPDTLENYDTHSYSMAGKLIVMDSEVLTYLEPMLHDTIKEVTHKRYDGNGKLIEVRHKEIAKWGNEEIVTLRQEYDNWGNLIRFDTCYKDSPLFPKKTSFSDIYTYYPGTQKLKMHGTLFPEAKLYEYYDKDSSEDMFIYVRHDKYSYDVSQTFYEYAK